MLILSKYKDYYDYLVGIYGIDQDIVLDRRGYLPMPQQAFSTEVQRMIFGSVVSSSAQQAYSHCVVEIVDTLYIFRMYEGVLKLENTMEKKNGQLYQEVCKSNKYRYWGREAKCVFHNQPDNGCGLVNVYFIDYDYQIEKLFSKKPLYEPLDWYQLSGYCKEIFFNVILNGTRLTGHIDPQQAYDKIYNHLIALREPQIVDKRTDIEKLEGHGFDKKSSFRNIK